MAFSFWRSSGVDAPITIPAIGLHLFVRMPPTVSDGAMTVIETINAPGFGPPRHRHKEAEVFRVLEGRYLYEVDGKRFHAEAGDLVSVPGSAEHAFVNVTSQPARQLVMIVPGFDAEGFFTGFSDMMRNSVPDQQMLNDFGGRWGVEFLGPPLKVSDS